MSKSKFLLTILFACIAQVMMAQSRVISGTVEDAMGPIMMANVVERDGNNRIISATQTDMMGNFSMEIKNPKNKLVISYVGSKTKILPIGNQKTFKIKLEDDKTGGRTPYQCWWSEYRQARNLCFSADHEYG